MSKPPGNEEIADVLEQIADLLETQEANPYRVQAYRRGAVTIRGSEESIAQLVEEKGAEALEELPDIGAGLAATIGELVSTGSSEQLQYLQEEVAPQARVAAKQAQPDVQSLLEVDEEYRQRAAADELYKIAPRRFNPQGEAWLPILRTERDGWQFTVLFSNTERAHEQGATDDWVVLYYQPVDDGEEEQATVVTETQGPLEGRRVVRGREADSQRYYEEAGEA